MPEIDINSFSKVVVVVHSLHFYFVGKREVLGFRRGSLRKRGMKSSISGRTFFLKTKPHLRKSVFPTFENLSFPTPTDDVGEKWLFSIATLFAHVRVLQPSFW
jgi:hypothetical protein